MKKLQAIELTSNEQTYEITTDGIHIIPIDSIIEHDSVIKHTECHFFFHNPQTETWEEISKPEYEQMLQENLQKTTLQRREEEQTPEILSTCTYQEVIPQCDAEVVTVQTESAPSFLYHNQSIVFNVQPTPTISQKEIAVEKEGDFIGIDGNFSVQILSQNNYIEENDVTVKYKFLLKFGQFEQIVLIPSSDVCSPQWVELFTHGKAYLHPGKKASQAFSKFIHELLLAPNLPQITTFAESGWKQIEGRHVYVHAGGAIGNLPDNMKVYGNPEFCIAFRPNMVGDKEIFNTALQALEITRNPCIMSVIFTFAHTAVLTSLYAEAGHPVKFILALLGLTNSKKTSLALATLRLFNTQNPSPDITFSSTPGGIEIALSRYNDAVLIIDDCMPATNRSRQNGIDGKFDDIARAIGDRTPKKRMYSFSNSGEKGKEFVSKCCGAITGEQLHGVQSALARTLQLEITRDDVINERLQFFQENYDLLPTHTADFIGYISCHYPEIVQFIKTNFPLHRALIKTRIPRFTDTFAVLSTTVEIIGNYIYERKYRNKNEIDSLKKKVLSEVAEIIFHNDKRLFLQEPGTLILEALENARIEKSIPFISRCHYDTVGNVILYDENLIYARAETLLQITQRYCQTLGVPIALIDKKAVITALEHNDALDFSKERARKLPKNDVDGRRYLYIKKAKIAEILNQTEEE